MSIRASVSSSTPAARPWLTPLLCFLGGGVAGADPVTLYNDGLGDDLYGLFLAPVGATAVVVIAGCFRGAWTRR